MPYQQVTLATLRAELQGRVEDSPYWTATEATNAINETLRLWNLFTGMWKARQTVVTVANQVWYTFTNSFVYNMRVEFNSVPMEQSSIFNMDNGRANWEGETTASSGVPTTPRVWAPAGLKMLAIWPADAAGGNTLTIDGVTTTPVLVNDTDTVDLGTAEHGPLLDYALTTLAFKEGGLRFSTLAQQKQQNFYRAAAEQNSRLSTSSFFRQLMGLDVGRYEKPMGLSPKES